MEYFVILLNRSKQSCVCDADNANASSTYNFVEK